MLWDACSEHLRDLLLTLPLSLLFPTVFLFLLIANAAFFSFVSFLPSKCFLQPELSSNHSHNEPQPFGLKFLQKKQETAKLPFNHSAHRRDTKPNTDCAVGVRALPGAARCDPAGADPGGCQHWRTNPFAEQQQQPREVFHSRTVTRSLQAWEAGGNLSGAERCQTYQTWKMFLQISLAYCFIPMLSVQNTTAGLMREFCFSNPQHLFCSTKWLGKVYTEQYCRGRRINSIILLLSAFSAVESTLVCKIVQYMFHGATVQTNKLFLCIRTGRPWGCYWGTPQRHSALNWLWWTPSKAHTSSSVSMDSGDTEEKCILCYLTKPKAQKLL